MQTTPSLLLVDLVFLIVAHILIPRIVTLFKNNTVLADNIQLYLFLHKRKERKRV
jgi:hypothetical protein